MPPTTASSANRCGGILAAIEGESEWCERLRLGFLAFAGQIAGSPESARLALVEVFAAGAAAVERMQRTNQLFEAMVAKNLALADGSPRPPPLVVKGVVAGGSRVARARLLSGRSGNGHSTEASRWSGRSPSAMTTSSACGV